MCFLFSKTEEEHTHTHTTKKHISFVRNLQVSFSTRPHGNTVVFDGIKINLLIFIFRFFSKKIKNDKKKLAKLEKNFKKRKFFKLLNKNHIKYLQVLSARISKKFTKNAEN